MPIRNDVPPYWGAGAQEPVWQEEFTAAARAVLADGGELGYRVGVKIALAALPRPACPSR